MNVPYQYHVLYEHVRAVRTTAPQTVVDEPVECHRHRGQRRGGESKDGVRRLERRVARQRGGKRRQAESDVDVVVVPRKLQLPRAAPEHRAKKHRVAVVADAKPRHVVRRRARVRSDLEQLPVVEIAGLPRERAAAVVRRVHAGDPPHRRGGHRQRIVVEVRHGERARSRLVKRRPRFDHGARRIARVRPRDLEALRVDGVVEIEADAAEPLARRRRLERRRARAEVNALAIDRDGSVGRVAPMPVTATRRIEKRARADAAAAPGDRVVNRVVSDRPRVGAVGADKGLVDLKQRLVPAQQRAGGEQSGDKGSHERRNRGTTHSRSHADCKT